jgi:hypothetical protein
MTRLASGHLVTALAVGAAALGPAYAPRAGAENYRIDHRSIPSGFEAEAGFFERVKWPKEPTGTFRETQAPAWDLAVLARYIAAEGIEWGTRSLPADPHDSRMDQNSLDVCRIWGPPND